MKRLLNQFLATIQLALRRTWTALGSHAAVALGVLVATTTICALLWCFLKLATTISPASSALLAASGHLCYHQRLERSREACKS
jgi:hypothetical protein